MSERKRNATTDPPSPPLPGASTPAASGTDLPGANWGIGTVVLLVALAFLVVRLAPVFASLLGAMLLAALLTPVVRYLECLPLGGKRQLGRPAASILAVLGGLLLLAVLIALTAPILWTQAGNLLGNFPDILQGALDRVRELTRDRMRVGPDIQRQIDAEITRMIGLATHSIAEWIVSFAFGIFDLLGYLVMPLGAFYLLMDGAHLRDLLLETVPGRWRQRWRTVIDEAGNVLAAWVRGMSVVVLSAAALYSTLFAALGLPFWLAIGALAGLLEVVPFLGAALAVIVIAIVGLSDSLPVAVRCVIAYIVANQIVNYLITPRFLSRALDLHPFIVIFAVLAGGTLAGPGGSLVAIPVVAVLNALTRRLGQRPRSRRSSPAS